MGYYFNDVASIENKVVKVIINNPSMLYSFIGDDEISGHSMARVGHPFPNYNIDHNSSTSLRTWGSLATNELII